MFTTTTKSLAAFTAIAALALPGAALASGGADDPAGHERHSATEVHHGTKHTSRHHRRHSSGTVRHHSRGLDDAVPHARGGADDGPNHT